jgi:hypothetical protein
MGTEKETDALIKRTASNTDMEQRHLIELCEKIDAFIAPGRGVKDMTLATLISVDIGAVL